MAKKLIYSFLLLFSLMFSPKLVSQGDFFLHFGPSFPQADFGDDRISKAGAGGANMGMDLGAKVVFPLSKSGLGVFLGADFMYNGLQGKVKEEIENNIEQLYGRSDIKYFKYINVPVLAGLNYTHKGKSDLGFFGELGIGVDFFKMTRFDVDAAFPFDEKFYLSSAMAIKLGGGLMIKDKFSIGLHYLMLGTHNVEGERDVVGDSYEFEYPKQDVSLVTLTFGIKI